MLAVPDTSAGMDADNRPEIDPRHFRRVMSRFASGVTVITTGEPGAVRGMTATAFMSGSLEPPLCVVCVAKRANMHAELIGARYLGVNILAEGQEDLASHFAGRPVPGVAPGFVHVSGAALMHDASARIGTEIIARHDCGDHTLFIGHIVHMDADDRPPLIYHGGRYAAVLHRRTDPEVAVPEFW
jgi:flavin reductase (DIM6/NTAB) family NADH-FMN oxidoreductase RutF